VIFQLTGTGTENWPSKRTRIETGIEITSYRIQGIGIEFRQRTGIKTFKLHREANTRKPSM